MKVTICTTNSNINKKTLYKHEITLAVILTQKREHDSQSFRLMQSLCDMQKTEREAEQVGNIYPIFHNLVGFYFI